MVSAQRGKQAPIRLASTPLSVVEACGQNNIRIICKCIRTVDRILAPLSVLPDAILSNLLTTAVVLSVIHFKGFKDGPPMDYALSFGEVDFYVRQVLEDELDKAL